MCNRKQFETKAVADKFRRVQNELGKMERPLLGTYRCNECNKYHVTSKKPKLHGRILNYKMSLEIIKIIKPIFLTQSISYEKNRNDIL